MSQTTDTTESTRLPYLIAGASKGMKDTEIRLGNPVDSVVSVVPTSGHLYAHTSQSRAQAYQGTKAPQCPIRT